MAMVIKYGIGPRRIGTQLFAHAGISLKKAGDATRTPQQKQSDQKGAAN